MKDSTEAVLRVVDIMKDYIAAHLPDLITRFR